jgi:hypothetical protein
MSDKVRRILLICLLVFAATGAVLVMRGRQGDNKTDPTALPPPSREFDQWHQNWEKQR